MEPYDDREPAAVHVLWGRVIVLGGALVLAFVLGLLLAGDGSPSEEQIRASEAFQNVAAQRDSLQTENEQLQQQLDQLSRGDAPSDAPTVADDQSGQGQSGSDGQGSDGGGTDGGGGGSGGGGDGSGGGDRDAARVYVVRQGDTLSGIAQRFYGSGGLDARERIADANGIEPDATLQVGDELTIPPADG